MKGITPFLWFDGQAEEAANFYVSIFPNSRVLEILRHGEAGTGPVGSVLTVTFELDGNRFVALNGGPQFHFNESVSFMVECDTQAEVDHYWEKLTAGGTEVECGWLKDRYGLVWQITPAMLLKWIQDPDPAKARRTMEAMLRMKKLDLDALERAHDGRA